MDTVFSLSPLLAPLQGALMPALGLQLVAQTLGWAVVLAALAAYALRPFPPGLRLAGVLIALAVCGLPGQWSPRWWLGLAFQTPSLTLQGLCALYLFRMWQLRAEAPVATLASAAYARWPNGLLVLALIPGWLMVFDMVAMFDMHWYAIGFTPAATFGILLVAAGLEWLSQRAGHPPARQKYRDVAAVLLAAMIIHLLTRLPTGNAWDAAMDPWLWLVAQATLLSRVTVWFALLARVKARQLVSWALGRAR